MIDTDISELTQMMNRNNHEVSETIQDLNILIKDIRYNNKELADKLEEEKVSLADRTFHCPRCGSNIIEIDVNYEPSEYFGQPVQERIPTYGCEISSCGYIKR